MNKRAGLFFLLFVFYAGIRLVPFFFTFDNTNRFFLADSYQYSELGASMALHGYYVPDKGEPGLQRSPGYPFFLSIVYRIFGVRPAIALFFQILLSGFIPIFLYLNAELLFSKRIAKIAAVLSIFEPVSIIYSNILLSETLFVLFLLMSTYFLIESLKQKDTPAFILSAITAGMAAYLRPIMLYAPCMYAALYIIASRLPVRDRLKYAAGMILITGLTVLPWMVRNYMVDGYKGFCSIQDINLYHWRAAGVVAETGHIPLKQAQDNLDKAVPQEPSIASEYQFYRDKGASIILHHLHAYSIVVLKGSINMLLSPERYAVFKLEDIKPKLLGFMWQRHTMHDMVHMLFSDPFMVFGAVIYQIIFTVVTGLLIIMGIIIITGEGFIKELLFLVFIIAYFVIVSAGPEAEPRFRLTVLPYMIILASAGISALFTSVASKHYKKRIK